MAGIPNAYGKDALKYGNANSGAAQQLRRRNKEIMRALHPIRAVQPSISFFIPPAFVARGGGGNSGLGKSIAQILGFVINSAVMAMIAGDYFGVHSNLGYAIVMVLPLIALWSTWMLRVLIVWTVLIGGLVWVIRWAVLTYISKQRQ